MSYLDKKVTKEWISVSLNEYIQNVARLALYRDNARKRLEATEEKERAEHERLRTKFEKMS